MAESAPPGKANPSSAHPNDPARALTARLRRAAIHLLARREYSRQELRQKLTERATRWLTSESKGAGSQPERGTDDQMDSDETAALISELLDELGSIGLQSDRRTAEVLLVAKATVWGPRRLGFAMHQRGIPVPLASAILQVARAGELARAHALWNRRFGPTPGTHAEQLRQTRWLIARGFEPEVVRRVVRGTGEAADVEETAP